MLLFCEVKQCLTAPCSEGGGVGAGKLVARGNHGERLFPLFAWVLLGAAAPLDVGLVDVLVALDALFLGSLEDRLHLVGANLLIMPNSLAVVHLVT